MYRVSAHRTTNASSPPELLKREVALVLVAVVVEKVEDLNQPPTTTAPLKSTATHRPASLLDPPKRSAQLTTPAASGSWPVTMRNKAGGAVERFGFGWPQGSAVGCLLHLC